MGGEDCVCVERSNLIETSSTPSRKIVITCMQRRTETDIKGNGERKRGREDGAADLGTTTHGI